MRVEIFVVKPYSDITYMTYEEKKALETLETIKAEIIREFGGLTESGEETGYWSSNGSICVDSVKRWLIYTESKDTFEIIEDFAKKIKATTAQKSQAFAINDTLYFV